MKNKFVRCDLNGPNAANFAANLFLTKNVMMIIKYKTIVGSTTVELDRAVSELLQEGYTLYGNPYASGDGINGFVLCQALVVDESPDPDTEIKLEAAATTSG